ncbi:hypothetical protein BKA93DRAFT_566294 [Sparassis latifolia]
MSHGLARDREQPGRATFDSMVYGTNLPSNHRDASSSSSRMDPQRWKEKQATPIIPPVPGSSGHSRSSNPWSGRMGSNLHGPKTGNHTATRTVLDIPSAHNHTSFRPAKRPRLDSTARYCGRGDHELDAPVAASKFFGNPAKNENIPTNRNAYCVPNLAASRRSEPTLQMVYVVDDDDDIGLRKDQKEDIGVVMKRPLHSQADYRRRTSSPDPLNVIDLCEPGPSSIHPDGLHDFDTDTQQPRNRGARDGVATKRLQRRLHNKQTSADIAPAEEVVVDGDDDVEVESIESASGFGDQPGRETSPSGLTKVPAGTVREMIARFEPTRSEQLPPTVDFDNLPIKQATRKSKMKSRTGLNIQPIKQNQLDAVATAPSGFDSTAKKKGTKRSQSQSPLLALPVEAFLLGLEMNEAGLDPYWLIFDPNTKVLSSRPTISGAATFFELNADSDIEAMT